MQKKIIALAIAGLASTAAFAQTNVTVYGVVDLGQAWVKGDANGPFGGDDQKTVGRLDNNSSHIGFKGVEDLGNGLKAIFQVETGVNTDNGGGWGASRDTFVGLTGGFGTVVLGNLTHPLRAFGAKVDILPGAAGFGTVASVTGAIAGIKTGADDRAKNAIAYVSPNFGGFSVTGAYINGEFRTDTPANDANTMSWQVAGQYDNGPLFIGLGYHQVYDLGGFEGVDAGIARVAATYTAPFGTKFTGLYDFTKIEDDVDGDVERAAWSLGVAHTFGKNTLGLQYGQSEKTEVSGFDDLDDKAEIWTVSYAYALSKRTQLHARYSVLENGDEGAFNFYNNAVSNGSNPGFGAEYSGVMVGLRHTF
jgi:predicted porin